MRGTVLASLTLVAVAMARTPAMAEPVAPKAATQAFATSRIIEHETDTALIAPRQPAESIRDRVTIRMSPLQLGTLTPESFGDWSQTRN